MKRVSPEKLKEQIEFLKCKKEIIIYSREKELLLKLLENYEPQTELEKSIKFSIRRKIEKIHYLKLSDKEVAEEVKDKIGYFEPYMINWYLEEDAFPVESFIFKSTQNHAQYSENYWAGILRLSNDDGIHLSEAIKILKKENTDKYKELIEKVSKSFYK